MHQPATRQTLAFLGALGVLAVSPRLHAQTATPDAKDVLQKTLTAYSSAKSYQGNWTYTLQQGNTTQKMSMEIKSKGNGRLFFRVAPVGDAKPVPGTDPLPEMLVVLDGKTAYFENRTSKEFYQVRLPKNPQSSPLMFFPAIAATTGVKRLPDTDDKNVVALQAETTNGGITRMEIDSMTYHLRRIVAEVTVAFVKHTSVIAVEKEVFDAEIPDSQFTFKAAKGSKERPAPPGTEGLFGPPGT
jgi:outer membrane lipoprotein-sorting protein